MIIIWTNLVDFEFSMLYTKILPQSFFGSGDDFQVFTIYGHGGHLVQLHGTFEQIGNTVSTKGPMWNLVKIAQAVSEKKTFKNYRIL